MTTHDHTEQTERAPPPYDPAATGRVAKRIQIESVELLGAHFQRPDDGALPEASSSETVPEIGIDVAWSVSEDGALLGCVLTLGTFFDGEGPYDLVARFRLLYAVEPGEPLDEADLEQFVHWNAVFTAWPYWREYLSSTLDRAQLPAFAVPVLPVPRPGE